ncbi:MAG TPA: hypothetical protein EYH55_05890 [Methanothermococcus okinawensis]|uniref:Uncharacterized protein n=1 Tax=Methanothermococcus okinawensis TaxID=155863 RepID=A0A833EBJ5_9EURY|nr:hypothetical protein [Methanothermococcus okinawensis]
MVSLSMCIESTWKNSETEVGSKESSEDTNEVNLVIKGQPVTLVLRTTVREALSTKLINTNDSDIVKNYLNHKIIYLEYNRSLPLEEGKVTVIDLSMKLGFLKPLYGHLIVDDSVFKNESEREKVKASNITLIVKVVRGNRSATIEKIGSRTYVIEGNSLKELDKAESRFVLAIYRGIAENS